MSKMHPITRSGIAVLAFAAGLLAAALLPGLPGESPDAGPVAINVSVPQE